MVSYDSQRSIAGVSNAGDRRGCFKQGFEQVDIVVAVYMLHDRRDPLKAHAGIHGRLRQRDQGAIRLPVELHEYQIPDFDVAIPVGIGTARRATGNLGAMVIEYFRTGPTGSGVSHCPEIVLLAHAGKTGRINTHFLQPDVGCLVIIIEYRDPELFSRQPHFHGKKFPGIPYSLPLEIIAKAEVAQHLEKRVMASRITDVFQIIVLAAGTNTAL